MKEALEVVRLVEVLFGLLKEVIAAAATGDAKRVQQVLPPTLLTTLARARAEVEAHQKFGSRG